MKIAVVHDWEPDLHQEMTWKDGLARAIQILGNGHDVRFFTLHSHKTLTLPHPYFDVYVQNSVGMLQHDIKNFAPDVILHWADCTRPSAKPLRELGIPMALCFAGGNTEADNWLLFEHIFVENEVYKQKFLEQGHESVSVAFGTNTDLFKPVPDQPKRFDTIFPATFCEWKRHKLYTDATKGLNNLACGYMYEVQESHCHEYPREHGVVTLPHTSADALRWLYAASKVCVVTSRADGGSQRTVLEAMAMNMPVVVVSDSDKTTEYLRDAGLEDMIAEPNPESIRQKVEFWIEHHDTVNTREYILNNWTATHYAENIEKGLHNLLKAS